MSSYALWMLCSVILCSGVFCISARRLPRCVGLSFLTLAFGTVLGAVMSKLLYYITQLDFMLASGWLQSLVSVNPAEWSVFGGACGVCLGVCLAARVLHVPQEAALNAFAPAGALLLALARFGTYFLRDAMIGFGGYMEDGLFCFFPLAIGNEWGEHYLAVFMLEGLCALGVLFYALMRLKTKRFLRTLYYVCLLQIFCESLRSDSISWLFVRVEQLLCMIVVFLVLLRYCAVSPTQPKRYFPLYISLICVALFVGVEFALDKTDWPVMLIYGAMLMGLAALTWAEHLGFRTAYMHGGAAKESKRSVVSRDD